jgi:hypothetical protein
MTAFFGHYTGNYLNFGDKSEAFGGNLPKAQKRVLASAGPPQGATGGVNDLPDKDRG